MALAFGAPLVFVYVMSRLPPAKAKEYLSAELGALLGAVLAVPLAALVFFIGLRVFRFESLEDLDRSIKMGLAGGVVTLILGSSIGCWFALRRTGYPAPKKAARMLLLLLLVTYLAAVTPGSGVDFEPLNAQAILATLIPLVMPLVATWMIGLVPKSLMIQALVLLLLGFVAKGVFASRSDRFSPTPAAEVTPPPENQLPLGSENPCWAGTYPDDLASLESEHRSASEFLADPETKDIYISGCIYDRLTQGANWPPGVAERLVQAVDL